MYYVLCTIYYIRHTKPPVQCGIVWYSDSSNDQPTSVSHYPRIKMLLKTLSKFKKTYVNLSLLTILVF